MVMNLYRNIDRSKVQFDFIIHTKDKCDYHEDIVSLGGRIYSIPRYKGVNFFQYMRAWHRFLKAHPEYKIIHGHVRSTASIYLRIAKKYGLVTIAHSHSTSSGTGFAAILKNLLQYPIRYTADYLFACSKSAGVWLFGKRATKKEKFLILKNAIDTKKYIHDHNTRLEKRKELQIEGKFVIGHVGRFSTPKNHDLLIEIFKVVHDKNKNAILLMVGDGELRPIIENKVNDLGLTNSVIFMGVRSDIPEILQAMDVFLFPSLFEGLGIVAIEAQAAGLPCIVSESIPKEAYITDLIKSLPFSNSLDEWAEHILYYSNSHGRSNMQKEIDSSGYDINGTVHWIQNFYLGNYGEYEHRNRYRYNK
ncbi:glycosyl transferase family 1 [Priestia megaterium]|nr:glycosyl transferase family 1 [Priestia megaterium]